MQNRPCRKNGCPYACKRRASSAVPEAAAPPAAEPYVPAPAPMMQDAGMPMRRWPHPIAGTAAPPDAQTLSELKAVLQRQTQLLEELKAVLSRWEQTP